MSIAVDLPSVNVLRHCPVCRRSDVMHLVSRHTGDPEPICHSCKKNVARAARPPRPATPAGQCPDCCDLRIWMFSAAANAYQPVCAWCISDAIGDDFDHDGETVLEPTPLESIPA